MMTHPHAGVIRGYWDPVCCDETGFSGLPAGREAGMLKPPVVTAFLFAAS